jgi:RNA polymerase sigma-70 factor (ECF subfamily)
MTEISDEAIVERILCGEIDDFTVLIDRYQKQIFGVGMRFFKNEADTYDFVQEIFIKAYTKLSSYKKEAPFRFWLSKIAYNHAINQTKQHKKMTPIKEDVASEPDTSAEEIHAQGEIKDVLLLAMQRLPEHYQICLDFYFFLGLTYNQISEITKLPINTIKSHIYRAKQLLRRHLRGTIAEEHYGEV